MKTMWNSCASQSRFEHSVFFSNTVRNASNSSRNRCCRSACLAACLVHNSSRLAPRRALQIRHFSCIGKVGSRVSSAAFCSSIASIHAWIYVCLYVSSAIKTSRSFDRYLLSFTTFRQTTEHQLYNTSAPLATIYYRPPDPLSLIKRFSFEDIVWFDTTICVLLQSGWGSVYCQLALLAGHWL